MTSSTAPERSAAPSDYPAVKDYALIGDCRSAALVSKDGSIDWLCWPRFDSASLFGRLLDARAGGHFSIAPTVNFDARRSYRPDSNVLETEFYTDSGSVRLIDLMVAVPSEYRQARLLPQTLLIRRVQGTGGRVPVRVEFSPAPDYAQKKPELRRAGEGSLVASLPGPSLLHLASDVDLQPDGSAAGAEVQLGEGESATFMLAFTGMEPGVFPPLTLAEDLIEETDRYWREWAGQCSRDVAYRDAAVRSALAIKLMSFSPSGAFIASPTTSLPEVPGGDKNWDYRFCWLRDASLIVRALMGIGIEEEARAYVQWLMHATRLSRPRLKVMYDLYGRDAQSERSLEHFLGWRGAAPVRVGNGARDQEQLDIYGEVMDAITVCFGEGADLSHDERGFVEDVVKYARKHWREPDSGIWESRGNRKHFVNSKVMCWLALTRGAVLAERGSINLDPKALRAEAAEIEATVRSEGYSEALQSFRRVLGEDDLDASSLRFPLVEFCQASDKQMAGTIEAVRKHLGREELVYRNRADIESGEGTFGVCSFWLVSCLALQDRMDEAREMFARLLDRANDVGLLPEEIDPDNGSFLGNFPLAFTHVGLINAALALSGKGGKP